MPPAQKTNILSIISLIVGIVSFLGICVSWLIPIAGPICLGLLAIGAIVTGFIGMSQAKKNMEKGRGMAIAGLVLGILALLVACALGIVSAIFGANIGNIFSNINNSLSGTGY
jgi:hypothetical protein